MSLTEEGRAGTESSKKKPFLKKIGCFYANGDPLKKNRLWKREGVALLE